MSLVFSKSALAVNHANEANFMAQWSDVRMRRRLALNSDNQLAAQIAAASGMAVNEVGRFPADTFKSFDRTITRVFTDDEGEVLLNDLMPLSRSLPVGKVVYEFARASDSGNAITTLNGQSTVGMDAPSFDYDGTIVPIHQDGFGVPWRRYAAQQSEAFDEAQDAQYNSARAMRRQLVKWILDGDAGMSRPGASWEGLRNDGRVIAIDLAGGGGAPNVDLVSPSTSGADIRKAIKYIADQIRLTNKADGQVTFHVSRATYSNMDRPYNEAESGFRTILDMCKGVAGVADIKETAAFEGNELSAMVLDQQYVRPLVGMAVNTVALPRMSPMDAYNFMTWSAFGMQVVTDAAGRSAVAYAKR